jgi:hypothetical protein
MRLAWYGALVYRIFWEQKARLSDLLVGAPDGAWEGRAREPPGHLHN